MRPQEVVAKKVARDAAAAEAQEGAAEKLAGRQLARSFEAFNSLLARRTLRTSAPSSSCFLACLLLERRLEGRGPFCGEATNLL